MTQNPSHPTGSPRALLAEVEFLIARLEETADPDDLDHVWPSLERLRDHLPSAGLTDVYAEQAADLAARLTLRAQEHRSLFGSSKDYELMEEAAAAVKMDLEHLEKVCAQLRALVIMDEVDCFEHSARAAGLPRRADRHG